VLEENVVTLYRPIGVEELRLIESSGFRSFPPRLPEQPIFYPVTTESYAAKIARDWNTRGGMEGLVTRFKVHTSYLQQFDRHFVGGREHEEYWIPAERLPEFNANIVGPIEVIHRFTEADRVTREPELSSATLPSRKVSP
jgi:hypothetical protein